MKHAILMTLHDNIQVVQTCMRMLDDERFTFYLLVDTKSVFLPKEFIPKLVNSKVRILPSLKINWASCSQIEAELILMEAALKEGNEYLHFLQGADLPLKNTEQIDSFFGGGGIFMDVNPTPDEFANYKVLCKHFFVNCKGFRTNKFLKLLNHFFARLQKPFMKLKPLYGKLYAGSATWSIPAEFAQYVMTFKEDILKEYRYSLAADEVFMHTILMCSKYRERLNAAGGVRLIDWKNREGNSPKTFTMADKEEIEQAICNPKIIFARKFSANKDFSIVKHIELTVRSIKES